MEKGGIQSTHLNWMESYKFRILNFILNQIDFEVNLCLWDYDPNPWRGGEEMSVGYGKKWSWNNQAFPRRD